MQKIIGYKQTGKKEVFYRARLTLFPVLGFAMRSIQCMIMLSLTSSLLACASASRSTYVSKSAESDRVTRGDVLHELDTLQTTACTYRCRSMVMLIYHLRRLGKDDALDLLRVSYEKQPAHWSPKSQLAVISICRILFQPPAGGWKEPWANYNASRDYVMASWGFTRESRAEFPLYPIAISDGVPFFLVQDWNNAAGAPGYPPLPDEAAECLRQCRTLEIISSDLPERGYDQAAIKLIKSEKFVRLFAGTGLDISLIDLWFVMQAVDSEYLYWGKDTGS